MAEIDEFLAGLEDDEEQEQQKPEVDPKRLGYALRQEQKEKKAMAKKLAELEAFQAGVLAEKKTSVLKTAGLNDFHSEAFSKFYEDVNDENLAAYKARAGLEAAPTESAPAPAPTGFSPTSGGEPLGAKVYTQKEFEDIMRENPAVGRALAEAGKVRLNNPQPESIVQ
jgi:hypothetical protein